jgi:hypothetical protein
MLQVRYLVCCESESGGDDDGTRVLRLRCEDDG